MSENIEFDSLLMLNYNFDEGLFTFLYDVNENLSKKQVYEILHLTNICFPNSKFKEDCYIKAKGDMTLQYYIDNHYIYKYGVTNDIGINIPVYIQKIDGQTCLKTTDSLGIELIFDESDESNIYGIKIYPYVYFDYLTTKNGTIIEQRKAADLNRKILKSFLFSYEKIVEAKPVDILYGHPLLEKNVYRYGIKEGAKWTL